MKFKVDIVKYQYLDTLRGFAVYEKSWFWGWERYDNLIWHSYKEATIHMNFILKNSDKK